MIKEHFVDTTVIDVYTFTREDIEEIIQSTIHKDRKNKKGIMIIDFVCAENCLDSCRASVTIKE